MLRNHPIYNGKQEDLVIFGNDFQVPSFTKATEHNDTSHASYRGRKRSKFEPFSFPVGLRVYNKNNALSMDEVVRRVNAFFNVDGPKKFKIPDTNYYFIGEFDGPIELDFRMNVINDIDLSFESSYSHKFYDGERIQNANQTTTIRTKSQIPTIPLIELTGLSGNDVQISISGKSFMRIRLSGNLPNRLTIDIENERIYETNSGVNMIDLLRIDSAFEDFRIEDGDVVTINNGQAKLTYKELLL